MKFSITYGYKGFQVPSEENNISLHLRAHLDSCKKCAYVCAMPNPVVALSKAWICDFSLAGIMRVRLPPEGVDFCLL
jgi:hypothetical protein